MGLFKPAYFHKKAEKRNAALDSLDESKLQALFLDEYKGFSKDLREQMEFRKECLKRIHDQKFLASVIVSSDRDLKAVKVIPELKGAESVVTMFNSIAFTNLTDEEYLFAVYAQCEDTHGIKLTAARRINNSALRLKIAQDRAMTEGLRISLIRDWRDKTVTAAVMKQTDNPAILSACTYAPPEGKDAQEIADRLAPKYREFKKEWSLRNFILRNCSEAGSSRLYEMALSDPAWADRDILKCIHDDQKLYALLKSRADSKMNFAIISEIKDPEILKEIMITRPDDWGYAERRLASVGKPEDAAFMLRWFNQQGRHESCLFTMAKLENKPRKEVLLAYADEDTVPIYLKKLEAAIKNLENRLSIGNIFAEGMTRLVKETADDLRTLYKAGIGKEKLGAMTGKELYAARNYHYSYCDGGHEDGHDDYPAYVF